MLPGWPQSPPLLGLWIIVLYVTHTVFTDIFSVALVFTLSKLKLHIHIFMLLSHIQELNSHIGTVATILDCEDLGRGSSATHTTNINAKMQTPFHSLNNIVCTP